MSEPERLHTSDVVGDGDLPQDEPLARDPEGGAAPLLEGDRAGDFETRWHEVQTGFVDEPRRSVEEADALVAELMRELAESFSATRSRLEEQWGSGDEVSTEDLRVALTRYRSFFRRLLAA